MDQTTIRCMPNHRTRDELQRRRRRGNAPNQRLVVPCVPALVGANHSPVTASEGSTRDPEHGIKEYRVAELLAHNPSEEWLKIGDSRTHKRDASKNRSEP